MRRRRGKGKDTFSRSHIVALCLKALGIFLREARACRSRSYQATAQRHVTRRLRLARTATELASPKCRATTLILMTRLYWPDSKNMAPSFIPQWWKNGAPEGFRTVTFAFRERRLVINRMSR